MRKISLLLLFLATGFCCQGMAQVYMLEVFPAEHRVVEDPDSGALLRYLTTDPAQDTNLYFHDRSWLEDGSLILFHSEREAGGLMGYLTETGELVRLHTPKGGLLRPTAAKQGTRVYALRERDVLELTLSIETSKAPKENPSEVRMEERLICTLPEYSQICTLNESCDGKFVSIGMTGTQEGDLPTIYVADVASGALRKVCEIEGNTFASHVQWSQETPYLLSYAGEDARRLWVVDIRDGSQKQIYTQWPGELVTHDSWWVNDQIVFFGGVHPKPTEDAHVKVLNWKTGEVRIIGAGAWWEDATPEKISRRNWWHGAGSMDGRWIAADNWHGDIMLFEVKTTRPRLLTRDHRTYGSGAHPHVGWSRDGKSVIFTSHKLGNPNVCVATIPDAWQTANPG